MRRTRAAIGFALICAAVFGANVLAPLVAEERPAETLEQRLAKASQVGPWSSFTPTEYVGGIDKFTASVKDDEVDALAKAMKGRGERARVSAMALARLARSNEKAFDAFVLAARAGNTRAFAGFGLMDAETARKASLAVLKQKALPEVRMAAAGILSIVGGKDDLAVLGKMIDEKPSGFLVRSYRRSLADLQYKLDKAKTDQARTLWARKGLEYSYLGRAGQVGHSRVISYWRMAQAASSRDWAVLPIDLLRYKISRGELLAIALAAHRKEPELVADLEPLARGSGDVGTLAKFSLSTIASEEAVNACLRVSSVLEETEHQHRLLAKFAGDKGGKSTLLILEKLSRNERLAGKVRSLYAEAMEKLKRRLETSEEGASKPTLRATDSPAKRQD